jgi:hypothetical protein
MRSRLAGAAAAIAVLTAAVGGAQAASDSPYAPYLVQRGDIPGISPYTTAVVPLKGSELRGLFGQPTAHWARSHGFDGGGFTAPQFNEPGVQRPYTGQVEAAVIVFRSPARARDGAARFLGFTRAVSEARHRPPLRVPHIPSASLVIEYGKVTGGTPAHPAAAAAIWTEGNCMLSVSIGGYTARARESYTRYTERSMYRIERRTHGRCSAARLRFRGGLEPLTADALPRSEACPLALRSLSSCRSPALPPTDATRSRRWRR